MKNKILLYAVMLLTIIWSCNKNKLNQPPFGLLYESEVASRAGVEELLIGAYSLLDGVAWDDLGAVGGWSGSPSNWLYGSICGSEAYAGSQQTDQPEMRSVGRFSAPATVFWFDLKWSAIYSGVARTNAVLRVMREAKDMTPDDTTEARAEALFLRGFYHFE